ncbi:MAG: coproporphyrinogen III oxidase [Alphaproteobacteria bacterium]|nr:MAG: coproporphyrinogen III oxidase [Alphaproteobacteria bacterium]
MSLFGLYIHWPFCKSRCPYCDYNAHVRERVDVAAFGEALLQDMRYWAGRHNPGKLTSIFFGGGTPSLMPPELAAELIIEAKKLWGFADNIEITLEANPTSSEAKNFSALRDAGVNRLSMGIQALDDQYLKFLGRSHSATEAKEAIKLAAKYFDRYSFDIIYARPDQTLNHWRKELEEILTLMRDHLSLYQLSVEPQTAFATIYARGDFQLPSDDHAAALYDYTLNRLARENFAAYEVSNFARNNDECRHNMVYWQYYDYIGIGPGAHGRISGNARKTATNNHKTPEAWLSAVQKNGNGLQGEEMLDQKIIAKEMILMNLRLLQGLDATRFRQVVGADMMQFIDNKNFEFLRAQDFIKFDGKILSATATGRNCLNELAAKLIA